MINRIAVKFRGRSLRLSVLLTAVMVSAAAAQAQGPAPASIHGHVNNAAGLTVPDATVRLTTDKNTDPKTVKWTYTFPVDANGDYKGTGIDPKTYLVVVTSKDVVVDYFTEQPFKAGEDKVVNFDMTRKEFVDKMTPEEKKNLEEYKKNAAVAIAANSKIANLNVALKQAREDNKAGNYEAALTSMTQATTQAPDQAILWITLGDAQLGVADKNLKAAKSSGKSPSDPDVQQKFTDAVTSYKKAIDLNAASKKPLPETAADGYNQIGQAYGKIGDAKNASDAYDNAAKAEPAKAGMYLFNEAATLYNAGKMEDAAAAADKAVAADPNKAEAYYIKGQALVQKASVDPKTQKVTVPPGCVDAYQKYLELAPEGAHAAEVTQVLTGIGETVKSSYKAGKKKS
ncbi:tetratricopeptide (TPR) repeat protein [Granulicella aggregans]|uniref:Tetratricopeptide (TPR) repeat protein n=1 Tax=Granulicella aggregans TaxID=474949 RepID=A0A7W7ZAA9_9BACT|nr:tetratricopeptide (TPR) repeat protein [Granulicella aggregans]